MTSDRPAKRVAASQVTMSQLMMPQDANPSGNVHGGTVLRVIDEAAAVAACRHCRQRVVTARLDEMSFLRPVFIGNVLTIKASVNAVGTTSMEVGVRAEAEDVRTGEQWHVASAYLIFVAIDEEGRPTVVPDVIAGSPEEKRRQRQAKRRKELREQHERELEQLRHEG